MTTDQYAFRPLRPVRHLEREFARALAQTFGRAWKADGIEELEREQSIIAVSELLAVLGLEAIRIGQGTYEPPTGILRVDPPLYDQLEKAVLYTSGTGFGMDPEEARRRVDAVLALLSLAPRADRMRGHACPWAYWSWVGQWSLCALPPGEHPEQGMHASLKTETDAWSERSGRSVNLHEWQ